MGNSKKTKKQKSREELENEYREIVPIANRFCEELAHQIETIIEKENVSLGFPLQHRVKTLDSLTEKFGRLSLQINSIKELQDLVGLRLILLFNRDLEKVCKAISEHFEIIKQENTMQRLKEDQFGYSSIHFLIKFPEKWLLVPSLSGFEGLIAEIQVRTVAQHIWASASHILQYKNEGNVPLPVRRSLSRVSALLETVDLEFERVLEERESYRAELSESKESDVLNVDLLENLLDSVFPKENKSGYEPYDELIKDLNYFNITTVGELKKLLDKKYKSVMQYEANEVIEASNDKRPWDNDRRKMGVFFTHVGLTRAMMQLEYGSDWKEYILDRRVSDQYDDFEEDSEE